MSLRSTVLAAGLAAAATLGVGAPAAFAGTPGHSSCFLSSNWRAWRSPSPEVIYLRVDVARVFRVDLAHPSSSLNDPSVHLLSKIRGSSWICDPLDLQLYVVDDRGALREPLFVKSMTELTPEEVMAIPARYRP